MSGLGWAQRQARAYDAGESVERIRERLASRAASAAAVAAREAKFPTLTADNFAEAVDYQEQQARAALAPLLADAQIRSKAEQLFARRAG